MNSSFVRNPFFPDSAWRLNGIFRGDSRFGSTRVIGVDPKNFRRVGMVNPSAVDAIYASTLLDIPGGVPSNASYVLFRVPDSYSINGGCPYPWGMIEGYVR